MKQLRQMTSPTRADLEHAARAFFDELVRDMDRPRQFPHDGFRESVAYNVHLSEESIIDIDRQLIGNEFDVAADRLADRLLAALNVSVADLDPASVQVARQLAVRAAREQSRYLIHMLTTPARPFVPEDKVFGDVAYPTIDTPAGDGPPAKLAGVSLATATKDFLSRKEDRGLGQSQLDETSRLLAWLMEALGDQRAIADIAKSELRGFRDDLKRIDVTLRGRPGAFRDRLTDDPEKQVVSATYSRYWNTALAFFAWCYSEGLIDQDPAAGLKIERRKGEVKRSARD